MESSLQEALNDQANHELFAALSYQAMTIWCEAHDYPGFAGFFTAQAAEEREHADKFINHMLDRGATPLIGAIKAPKSEFTSLSDIAQHALALEQLNTSKIKSCYTLAIESKEYETQPLLLWFIDEQLEEEAWAHRMITLTKRSECPGATLNLDRHITKILASDED